MSDTGQHKPPQCLKFNFKDNFIPYFPILSALDHNNCGKKALLTTSTNSILCNVVLSMALYWYNYYTWTQQLPARNITSYHWYRVQICRFKLWLVSVEGQRSGETSLISSQVIFINKLGVLLLLSGPLIISLPFGSS